MLKRNHKFTRDSFTTFFKNRKPFHSTYFVSRVEKIDLWKDHQAAFVVSKKVEKTASGRNKLKRRLYYALKELDKGQTKPYKAIFILKKSTEALSSAQIQDELAQILKISIK